jgi:ubiquinone/menaquinone biosynthesis C-methylase UbiE
LNQGFDRIAERYDRWYDEYEGQAIFSAEIKCLRSLGADFRGRWLEVGVGTGRFASVLGIERGMDPSLPMLRIAAGRGITAYAGLAEALPFPGKSFDGVLMALALCFFADCGQALKECERILRPQGCLLVGMVSGDGPWGRAYKKKKAEGHPVYGLATFHNIFDMVALIKNAGFDLKGAASTLSWNPEDPPEKEPHVETGMVPNAGFVGLLFAKIDGCCPKHL